MCHLKNDIFSLWPKYLIFVFCLCPSEESGLTPQHMINTVIEMMPCYFFNLHVQPIFSMNPICQNTVKFQTIWITIFDCISEFFCVIKLTVFFENHTHFHYEPTSLLVDLVRLKMFMDFEKKVCQFDKEGKFEKFGNRRKLGIGQESREPQFFDYFM